MFSLLLSLALLAIPSIDAHPTAPSPRVQHRALTNKVVSAWYAAYRIDADTSLANVDWSKYTQMTYAFAETTSDLMTFNINNETLLPEFVSKAQENGVRASLSLGGWGGSRFFSSHVGSPENRTIFVKSVTQLAQKYKLSAIDFDWEYPNQQGIGCNVVNPNDTANFLSYLQELRSDPVGASLTLSAATSVLPFRDPAGNPSTDVSGFSKVLDYIVIMNYDIFGPWAPTVGPNAPLHGPCANQTSSADKAVQDWSSAGMPISQIALGVPAYGHGFSVNQTAAYVDKSKTVLALYPEFNHTAKVIGDKYDPETPPGTLDVCGVPLFSGGTFTFKGMIEEGFLKSDGSVADGIDRIFDECSQTPFVYNKMSQIMVSYDDVQSFAAKGEFIKSMNLGGVAMWEQGGDMNDILINSVISSAGLSTK